jgi:hypothetical protein
MKLGKEFIDAYATFDKNSVMVEIPFISNAYFDGFVQTLTKCRKNANFKGDFTILATRTVIVGFTYNFGPGETREYIENILEIFSGLIMIQYLNQRDKAEIMEIQLGIAA